MEAVAGAIQGDGRMSVKPDVIARVLGIDEEDVKCRNCIRFEERGKFYWCKGWDMTTQASDFCSFFEMEGICEK